MKILAVDTATKTCSVAVVSEKTVISEYTVNHRDTHSRFLMEMIHDILTICRLKIKDLDGFAVTTGPGSFTGLRIGLSTVKGLALASGLPVVGVSTLEALADQFSTSDTLICPMLDARRNEVYTAHYRFRNLESEKVRLPVATSPVKAIENICEPCIMVGDGALLYQDLIKKTLGELAVYAGYAQHTIRASAIGHIALQQFQSNHTDDVSCIEPLYLRKSDAEKILK